MKYSCVFTFSFLLLITVNICAQEENRTICKDSLSQCQDLRNEKGELRSLLKKIHENFLIYTTGRPFMLLANPLPIGGKRKHTVDPKSSIKPIDPPIILDVTNEERGEFLALDNPKLNTPIDQIKSIEISCDKLRNSAIYGAKGFQMCIIKIKFHKWK